jgi:sulfite reductase alpha subunit
MAKHKTPLLDQLESGPWPSFVSDLKQQAEVRAKNKEKVEFQIPEDVVEDLLGVMELSFKHGRTHWKHGGIVGVFGYGGGVIGRYCDQPQEFPGVAHFHTMRVAQPGGKFYTAEYLRQICDLWDFRGSGITNMHGSTGDIILLGTTTDELEKTFDELQKIDFDIGGSGSDVRTPSCCVGMARCEWACYDTMAACYDFTQTFQDEIHRPAFPYKYKFKFAGCPNDCVASIARSDMSIIGTWRDDIQIDKDAVTEYAKDGLDIKADVVDNCPGKCMEWDGKELNIENSYCRRCMHCINVMPKALRPGKDRGATVLLGSKAPIVEGALLSSVLLPFYKMEPPYQELKDLVERIWDVWSEEGKNRERVGEFMQRVGLGNFLEAIELEPVAEMVAHPRENPYVFYEEYFEEDEDEEEEEES